MALANGDKAAICSVIVAVAVVLGLVAYGPSYVQDKRATAAVLPPAPIYPNSAATAAATTPAVSETSLSGEQNAAAIAPVPAQNAIGVTTTQIAAQTTLPETEEGKKA